ncbi:MAG: apolipoprotein N-acyltransferase [Crocinitomicaceae bacterium]|nr:apolipoprotein N-acyltransferase [Crocinitomicaceae bacterium]
MKISRSWRYLLSFLSGVLLTLSFPYTGSLTPLIFVALIPLLLVEHSIFKQRYKSSKVFIHAYITFIVYNIGTTWWIWNADINGAIMAFVLNSLLMALAFQCYHFIKKHIGAQYGLVTFISVWLGFEYLHFNWELSWPWLTLGNVFSITPSLVQWYEFSGVLGGSLWILLINYLLFKVVFFNYFDTTKSPFSSRQIALPVVILLLPISTSLWMYSMNTDEGTAAEVVLVQPNIDPYYKFTTITPDQQLHRIMDIADQTKTVNTKIVVAPETAIPVSFDEAVIDYDIGYHILRERMKDWGAVQLFLGASTEKRFEKKVSRAAKKDPYGGDDFVEYYNSSLLMGNSLSPKIVHKSKLVLGAEKVPFSHWFPFLEDLSLDFGGTSGTLGVEAQPTIYDNSVFSFTPSICYESIYGEYTAQQTRLGAGAIFVITNDGWWGDTPGYKQHFSFARLRAIENRKSVARSANTGTSGFINQRGDVVQSSKWWVTSGLRGTVFVNKIKTVYMTLGDIIGKLGLICAVIFFAYAIFRKVKPLEKREI